MIHYKCKDCEDKEGLVIENINFCLHTITTLGLCTKCGKVALLSGKHHLIDSLTIDLNGRSALCSDCI